jgi:hypothetical protein
MLWWPAGSRACWSKGDQNRVLFPFETGIGEESKVGSAADVRKGFGLSGQVLNYPWGLCPKLSRGIASQIKGDEFRKAGGLPHIRRQSRKEAGSPVNYA